MKSKEREKGECSFFSKILFRAIQFCKIILELSYSSFKTQGFYTGYDQTHDSLSSRRQRSLLGPRSLNKVQHAICSYSVTISFLV